MSYTTSGISVLSYDGHDLGLIVRAACSHSNKCVQCYVSGRLVAWQEPIGDIVEFVLTEPADYELVQLLAVDPNEAGVNYWAEAFGELAGANRITVQTPQEMVPYAPADKWIIYLGRDDQAETAIQAHQQDFYPGRIYCGGWGWYWGKGGWGYNGYDCAGWGNTWGLGQWGFDCEMLTWTSEPLAPGDYFLKIVIADAFGNISPAQESTVALAAPPRPASSPLVTSYDDQSDTLTLGWTLSPDDT